jgi:hypothetical protein
MRSEHLKLAKNASINNKRIQFKKMKTMTLGKANEREKYPQMTHVASVGGFM